MEQIIVHVTQQQTVVVALTLLIVYCIVEQVVRRIHQILVHALEPDDLAPVSGQGNVDEVQYFHPLIDSLVIAQVFAISLERGQVKDSHSLLNPYMQKFPLYRTLAQ